MAKKEKSVIAYKGMDKNMECLGYQYELGKEYEVKNGEVELCKNGFHACENPLEVFSFYPPTTSRFFEVEQSGEIKKNDVKQVSSKIEIKAEVNLALMVGNFVRYVLEKAKGKTAQGDYGHASAQGYSGHASAQGYSGHASALCIIPRGCEAL